jgi:hypothetical protein
MINLKKENKTYITGVLEKNEDEKSEYYIPNYLSCKSAKKISQTIEHSEPKRNKKIISIVFPIINPRSKKFSEFNFFKSQIFKVKSRK